MLRTITAVLVILFASISSQLVLAHGGATGIVKERMDLMDDMKGSVKQLTSIFKGEVEYNPATIRNAALVIRNHSGDAMTKLFPEGSSGHSGAKTILWQEWQRFEQLADRQKTIAQGLYNAAENNNSAPQPVTMDSGSMMGQNMMGSGSMMGQNMMDSGSMMGNGNNIQQNRIDPDHLGAMPSNMVFKMLTDNCSSCHTRYRKEM